MREIIATGKSVEEAIESGCKELGLTRDEVSIEILEMPVRKLFKTLPAKVKVTAAGEEEQSVPETKQTAPAAPVSQPTKTEPAKVQQPKEKQPAKQAVLPEEPEEEIDLAVNAPAAAAADYLKSIFLAMGADDVSITAAKQGDATLLRIEGESIGSVLEARGDTIQALSYLTDRAVNKGVDKKDADYLRVRIDIAGYRGRRENELISLAKRTGKEVAKTKRSRTLAPMNPYERLIIHTTISGMEGLVSESIGADSERRVVIKSTAPDATDGDDWRAPRRGGSSSRGRGGNGGNRGNNGNRGGNNNRSRGPRRDDRRDAPRTSTPEREYADKPVDANAAPVVPERRTAIKDGDDLPLYGKIEL